MVRARFYRPAVVLATLGAVLTAAPGAGAVDEGDDGWSRSFYWGVATSGYQVEGDAPDSNWQRWVEENAGSDGVDPYRDAVDFRHRYAEDIQLAADMGVNTFRFGVEWARVQPAPGVWDEAELAYYDDVVAHVLDAGMTPMITLNHFTEPGWVTDQGSWAAAETVDDFLAYGERIVERYQDTGALWVTFNEPLVLLGHEMTVGALEWWELPAARANVVDAHRRAYDLIHSVDEDAKVTSNQAFISGFNGATDLFFLEQFADKLDFVGIDYYYGLSLDNLSVIAAASGAFWDVRLQPEGIYYALRAYHRRFPDLPLFIVENGMPTNNGAPRDPETTRADNLNDTIYWVQRAKADGMNVIGYNYWSLTDNYEWGTYRARFGLYTVDVLDDPTLERRPTDAVAAYAALTANGGVPAGYELAQRPGLCNLVDSLASCLDPAREDGPLAPLR
ncbi:glycoside hydrolase family 1 protein [Streptomyces sp. NPDC127098]|uniref:glycoside hydrolase family 1 protein n=1 Tax=Streptomyces sp. NPDC127098 TaxID=3347137 RepID=UPI0036669271